MRLIANQQFLTLRNGFCLIASLLCFSCSPGMFLGSGTDSKVVSQKAYKKINIHCSEMKLSKAELDLQTFKALVECFNDNGSIDPLARLIQAMDDQQLQPLV